MRHVSMNTQATKKIIGTVIVLLTVVAIRMDRGPDLSTRVVTLCFGDSLTAGFIRNKVSGSLSFHPYSEAYSRALGPRAYAVPVGFSGWRSVDLIDGLRNNSEANDGVTMPGLALALDLYKPKLVAILVGTNDILKANSLGELNGTVIAARVWQLHDLAHRVGLPTLAIGIPEWDASVRSPPPPPVTNDDRAKAREALNVALSEMAKASRKLGADCHYVDFPLSFKAGAPEWSWDGLHFTVEGYDAIGNGLAADVMRLFPSVASASK